MDAAIEAALVKLSFVIKNHKNVERIFIRIVIARIRSWQKGGKVQLQTKSALKQVSSKFIRL